ncbi:AAA family ATPase [Herbidospora galbida]|uniref:AAA family ATPase n=1 Tax=Herbidospora galbida TaxID=2575442 RepID=A0A4U3M6S0_9ACTN|nr:AAA family ATPase [Herbidospora galbida]TKK83889.1 AAA family ATPase [Herbidospora galbida]
MYVTEIKISDVKGFTGARDVDLRLTRPDGSHAGWTVLAGRNGSGKTTILRAIALALAGPDVALSLTLDFEGWVTDERAQATVTTGFTQDADDVSTDDRPLLLGTVISWRPSGHHIGRAMMIGHTPDAKLGPWAPDLQGWFYAGYGPFRRLVGGSAEAQRLMQRPGPVSRLATLFNEDASLAEGVTWLIDLHLRRLEGNRQAAALLTFALRLLNDGLLPDGFQVDRVDSDGLWARRDGRRIPMREMSDGYRAVTALVLDLVRQMSAAFPESAPSAAITRSGVVLIDEIDAHLHVSWQQKIGGWLKAHFPNIQFIVTTHSPYICQSADPGGLIRLPGVDEDASPAVVNDDLYERVVYGSGDDALLSDLFGIETPYSPRAEAMRRRLVVLERAVLRGQATPEEEGEFEELQETLNSSLTARVDEVAARIRPAE